MPSLEHRYAYYLVKIHIKQLMFIQGVNIHLKQAVQLAPTQLRIASLAISQERPVHGAKLEIVITQLSRSGQEQRAHISLALTQRTARDHQTILATYLSGDATPIHFLAIPPIGQNKVAYPPILALRKLTTSNTSTTRSDLFRWRWR
jgi:hypothetical protein